MPTSHPWNPNPDVTDEERERGYREWPCRSCEGPDCMWCGGTCKEREKLPVYRPDKKIRCTLGVQGTPIRWLAWDDEEITQVKELICRQWPHLTLLRGWASNEVEVVPKHVGYFQRNDAHGKF